MQEECGGGRPDPGRGRSRGRGRGLAPAVHHHCVSSVSINVAYVTLDVSCMSVLLHSLDGCTMHALL